eukprot:scaffold141481_cov178-Phaeocystis_antarctica.AAC.1
MSETSHNPVRRMHRTCTKSRRRPFPTKVVRFSACRSCVRHVKSDEYNTAVSAACRLKAEPAGPGTSCLILYGVMGRDVNSRSTVERSDSNEKVHVNVCAPAASPPLQRRVAHESCLI